MHVSLPSPSEHKLFSLSSHVYCSRWTVGVVLWRGIKVEIAHIKEVLLIVFTPKFIGHLVKPSPLLLVSSCII